MCAEEHDGDGDGEFGPLVKRASLPTTRSHCRRAGLRVRWRRNIFRHRIGYFNRGHVRLGKVDCVSVHEQLSVIRPRTRRPRVPFVRRHCPEAPRVDFVVGLANTRVVVLVQTDARGGRVVEPDPHRFVRGPAAHLRVRARVLAEHLFRLGHVHVGRVDRVAGRVAVRRR